MYLHTNKLEGAQSIGLLPTKRCHIRNAKNSLFLLLVCGKSDTADGSH